MGKLLSKQYHRNKCEKYVRVMVNLYKVSNRFENHKYCYIIWSYKFHHYVKHEKNDRLIQQSKIFTCVMVLKPFGVLNSLNSLNFCFFHRTIIFGICTQKYNTIFIVPEMFKSLMLMVFSKNIKKGIIHSKILW